MAFPTRDELNAFLGDKMAEDPNSWEAQRRRKAALKAGSPDQGMIPQRPHEQGGMTDSAFPQPGRDERSQMGPFIQGQESQPVNLRPPEASGMNEPNFAPDQQSITMGTGGQPPAPAAPPPTVSAGATGGLPLSQVTQRRYSGSSDDPRIDSLIEELGGMERPNYADALRRNEQLGLVGQLSGVEPMVNAGSSMIDMEGQRRDLERQGFADDYTQKQGLLGNLSDERARDFDMYKYDNDMTEETMTQDGATFRRYINRNSGINPETGDFNQTSGWTKISPTSLEETFRTGREGQFVEDMMSMPESDAQLRDAERMTEIVLGGDTNFGPVEQWTQWAGQLIGSTAGKNTRDIEMAMAKVIIPQVKDLGFNPSNVDLKFVTKSVPKVGDPDEQWEDYMARLKHGLMVENRLRKEKSRMFANGRGRMMSPLEEQEFVRQMYPDGDNTYKKYLPTWKSKARGGGTEDDAAYGKIANVEDELVGF